MRISDWSSDVCSSDLAHRVIHLREAVKLALEQFQRVVQPGDGRGVLERSGLVALRGAVDGGEVISEVIDQHRVFPLDGVVDLVRQTVAVGAARLSGYQQEDASFQLFLKRGRAACWEKGGQDG